MNHSFSLVLYFVDVMTIGYVLMSHVRLFNVHYNMYFDVMLQRRTICMGRR